MLAQKDAEKLVHAFVTSQLDFCNSLLSGSSRKSLKTLQLVQNAAARVLTRTKKREHITPVLASLHWLPVKSRIEFKILLLTFKALNNMAPLYLKELIVPYQPTRAGVFNRGSAAPWWSATVLQGVHEIHFVISTHFQITLEHREKYLK